MDKTRIMNAHHRENLALFFKNTKIIFEVILYENDWFFLTGLQVLANRIWKEELQSKFEELKNEVINSRDDRLKAVGLAGDQLSFKLELFNYCYARYDFHDGIQWLNKLLNAINSILGSLALPFPIAEPIKEFKDFLEIARK